MLNVLADQRRVLATVLITIVAAYIAWKVGQSPEQALQFTFNGLSVGAVYALLAMGFTIVYSTVWFFDLYYGAAATLGAYGVFYLRSQESLGARYTFDSPFINILFAAIVAGVVGWALHTAFYGRLRSRFSPTAIRTGVGVLSSAAGAYLGTCPDLPDATARHPESGDWITDGPGSRMGLSSTVRRPRLETRSDFRWRWGRVRGGGLWAPGIRRPGAKLYLSWAVSCLLAGAVGLAIYRGLYIFMRQRAKSPLVMLVASLGILLAITAIVTIVFRSTARPLPDPFLSVPWIIGGASIKGFNVFTIGVALAGFAGLTLLLKRTSFGKAVRAIGDDEEVSKVVGINTTVIIAIVFFIGAAFAALAGLLSGHDTAIQPRMGLLLLLKGWIASVVGGIGNLYGAIVGGFILGLLEQFGIWDLAGEWKDVISFIVLIVFLAFWPNGLLPRK